LPSPDKTTRRITALDGVTPHWRRTLAAATPADKFCRPDEGGSHGHWLSRPRVNELIDRSFHRHGVVVLSAGPGYGKSVAAAQFIDIQGARGLWYRLGSEDSDARVVLAGLLHVFETAVPGFRCDPVEQLLEHDSEPLKPKRLVGAVNMLLHEISACIDELTYIAVDDFHLLAPTTDGGKVLLHALATLPPRLKCLVLTRHPAMALYAHLRPERVSDLGGGAVRLTMEETQELCRMLLHTAVPDHVTLEVHSRTQGWVQGVIAYAGILERQLLSQPAAATPDPLTGPVSAKQLGLDMFFEHHVLRTLSPAVRTRLCELVWLGEISAELARHALDAARPEELLGELAGDNLFLNTSADAPPSYRFHPIFADFLQRRAKRALPPGRPAEILCRAARYMVECGEYDPALGYRIAAEDYDGAEKLLQSVGMHLLSRGRYATVLSRLEQLPINRVARNPWLLLLEGITLMELNPLHALAPLEQARTAFQKSRTADGELLAMSQQVTHHIGVDGAYVRVEPLLKRLERLYDRNREKLDGFPGALADLALAGCYSLFRLRPDRTSPVLERALSTAQSLGSPNLEVRARIILCHDQLQRGELRNAVGELERLAPLAERGDIGDMGKALIQALQCHYLALADLPVNFDCHHHRFQRAMDQALFRHSVAAPLLNRWAAENALRSGRSEDARTEVESGLSLGYAASNPNLRSQFLLYRALLLALDGAPEKARQPIEEAQRFFARHGAGPFEAQRAVLLGASYCFLGDWQQADKWLREAIDIAWRLGARQVRAGAHAFAAYLALETGARGKAAEHLRDCLGIMVQHRYDTWFLLEPRSARRLLAFAAETGLHPELVEHLSRRHLGLTFASENTAIPQMRLEILGRLRLRCNGRALSGNHLSRKERTYIATLAASPHQQIDRERLIEAIWPGGEHTSANIYVVRNRLKKSVQREAPEVEANHYFTMTASVVRLENTWVDAEAYRQCVEAGLSHWVRGEHWQAECAFQEADVLWRGHFAPTAQENDLIRDYRMDLQRLTEQKTLVWSSLLGNRGAVQEAEMVLEQYLRGDPINDEVVRRLYMLRLSANALSAAERTLHQYRRHLEAEHFNGEEIERIIHAARGRR